MFNNNANLDLLDIITIISFAAQIDNMGMDGVQNKFIHKVIKSISNEIEKLHKENDIIMEQNEKILEILRRLENYDKGI